MKFQLKDEIITADFDYGTMTISGDETKGFRPFQLMLSSLVGCSVLVYKRILQKQKIEFDELTVEANVERSDDQVSKIEKVMIHFKVKGEDLKQEKLEKSLAIATKNCSMVQSVIGSIDVVETVEIVK
ncbi:OsmC family protein [Bacillaceae bacterium W0354]